MWSWYALLCVAGHCAQTAGPEQTFARTAAACVLAVASSALLLLAPLEAGAVSGGGGLSENLAGV